LTKSKIFAKVLFMSNKTKMNHLSDTARQASYILMAGAATLGMLELPDHLGSRITVPAQPAFAWANSNDLQPGNSIRRESEEVAPHYISYSVTQRTPARSKKL